MAEQPLTVQPDAAEATFRALLDAAPDAIVVVDGDGRIVLVNAQTEVMFGYGREELLGQKVELLLPARFREGHINHRERYGAVPHARPMGAGLDLFGVRRDGTEFPVEVSLGPVRTGGRFLVMSAIRDSTDRKQAELAVRHARDEAERANLAKSEFLSRMSHELRTPLNAVLGFAQLLELDPISEQQQRNVGRILRAGRHLLDLINEVLDIARIEAGRLQLSPEPVRVRDAAREALDLVRPLAAERGVYLSTESLEAPCWTRFVHADRQRLKQVLLNLLSNAVKYNRPAGSVTLTCLDTMTGRLRLAVSDTGSGIPPEQLTHLFSPFERLGAETTEIEGTGLGLALSKGLAEAMGGTLGVESVVGQGSTFWLELDLADDPRAAQALAGEVTVNAPDVAGQKKTRTILYVEDNLSNLELVEQILARWPQFKLVAAMQGRLGVDLAVQHIPDLVLLDVHLPDISGVEVLRQLRADARTRNIPVVVISADATRGQEERLLKAGARAYLTKPLDVPLFLRVLQEALPDE